MSNPKVLLLNASNKEDFPVYPYAFIQVSAIARQAGIEVICKDLLGWLPPLRISGYWHTSRGFGYRYNHDSTSKQADFGERLICHGTCEP